MKQNENNKKEKKDDNEIEPKDKVKNEELKNKEEKDDSK